MTNTKNTPTPWKIDTDREIIAGNGFEKVGLFFVDGRHTTREEDLANAAFIVRAVNVHEDLVKIAQAYRNLLRTSAHTEGEVATFHHIEDVLALAEEGEADCVKQGEGEL